MHETALVEGLLRIVAEEAVRHEQHTGRRIARITSITLETGLFTAVEPQTLAACFELAAEGTLAHNADLLIERVPAQALCASCGTPFPMSRLRDRCPLCQGPAASWQGGQECRILRLEVEEAPHVPNPLRKIS